MSGWITTGSTGPRRHKSAVISSNKGLPELRPAGRINLKLATNFGTICTEYLSFYTYPKLIPRYYKVTIRQCADRRINLVVTRRARNK